MEIINLDFIRPDIDEIIELIKDTHSDASEQTTDDLFDLADQISDHIEDYMEKNNTMYQDIQNQLEMLNSNLEIEIEEMIDKHFSHSTDVYVRNKNGHIIISMIQ